MGAPVNDIALAFLLVHSMMSFFPTIPDPDAADMKWVIVIFAVVTVMASLNYRISVHKHYIPPVRLVGKD